MEKEDKLIKKLLMEGMLKPAPDSFTESVMEQVSAVEEQKEAHFLFYLFGIAVAIIGAVGVIYFVNPEFLPNYMSYFGNFFQNLFAPFKNLFGGISFSGMSFQGSGFFVGIILIISLLLGFDRMLRMRSKSINIFM